MSIGAYADSRESFARIGADKNEISGENTGGANRLTEQSVKGGAGPVFLITAKEAKPRFISLEARKSSLSVWGISEGKRLARAGGRRLLI